jgi:hypothetical protein
MSKERNVLSQIIKSWAQDHDVNYTIDAPELGDQGLNNTASFFSWLIKSTNSNIDFLSLVDRLELYVLSVKNKKLPDGMFCHRCHSWYQFAEPNQDNGSLLCYSCRHNPYV